MPNNGQKWLKQVRIFEPQKKSDWMVSHAALPFAESVGTLHRIYFSSRDELNRSRIGFIEIDMAEPDRVLRVSEKPVLSLGALGSFDDSGVSNSWLVTHEGEKYLYYSGWSRGITVPFYFYVGLAISRDGGESFLRVSPSPVLERNEVDPYLTASPCVLIENGIWRMWYVSATKWSIEDGSPKHYYHIRYAESLDGIRWERTGRVCIDFRNADEHAISRPCVIKEKNGYRMWYSYRGERYRIGYAESKDGLDWTRKDDEIEIDVSSRGWDSDMIEYPFVFGHQGKRYMLYNGNGYGRTGIGLAVLSQ